MLVTFGWVVGEQVVRREAMSMNNAPPGGEGRRYSVAMPLSILERLWFGVGVMSAPDGLGIPD